MPMPAAPSRFLLLGLVGIGIANFIGFDVMSSLLGGEASNGRIVDGRYFLNSHGTYTEVGDAVFTYSLWHGRSVLVTHVLAGIASMAWYRSLPADPGDRPGNRLLVAVRRALAAAGRRVD